MKVTKRSEEEIKERKKKGKKKKEKTIGKETRELFKEKKESK